MIWLLLIACGGDDPARGDDDDDVIDTDEPVDTDEPSEPITVDGVDWHLHDDFATLAYLTWTQAGAGSVHVEYSVDAGVWLSSPDVPRADGPQQQLLLGLPYDTDVQWRIARAGEVLAEGGGVRTGPTPPSLPVARLEVPLADGRYLLTSVNESTGGWTGGPFWTVILDRAGRAVWARKTPNRFWTLFAQVSSQSPDHLLIDEDSMWADFDLGAQSRVARLYLDAPIDTVDTPGLQHAFVEHPDGTLAWGSLWHDDVESLVELAPGATTATKLWTCRDWVGSEHCESNGLFFDVASQSYLYSFWTNHSVLAVDRAGNNLWWAGTVPGGYDFVPAGSDFWLQHGVSYTDAGTLLLSSWEDGPTTMVREFEVDHTAHTLTSVWSFDAEVHAVTNGDAWRLDDGNTLHVVGSAGVIKEAAPDGSVLWHVDYHAERLLGRGELLDDLYALASP